MTSNTKRITLIITFLLLVSTALIAVYAKPPNRYCTITNPSDGEIVSGIVTIQVDAFRTPTILIDGNEIGTGYTVDWDTSQYSEGAHTIEAKAPPVTDIITVTVENGVPDNPPVVTIDTPTNGATVSGTTTISVSVTDEDTLTPDIYIDGSYITTAFSYDWDTTVYPNGGHTIYAEATDSASQTGSNEISVTVDNPVPDDPPVVTIDTPTNGATVSGTTTISVSVTDEDTLTPDIYIDGSYITTAFSYDWDTTMYIDGTHTIYAEATDSASQTGSDEIGVTVDNGITEPSGEAIKIMAFNIKESGESSTYPDWKEVVKEENADIVMFIETGYWDDNNNEKLNQYVNEFNTYFADEQPYEGYCTQGITYSTSGAAIMSRYPVNSWNQITHVPLDDGTSYDVTHDFLEAVVNIDGQQTYLFGSHLKAMTGTENEQRREWEQEGIINYMDNLGNVSIMYMGDLNSFSPEDIGINDLQSGLGYGPLSMMVPDEPDADQTCVQYASDVHTWYDVHRVLNPTDLGISNPAYDSRIDFIYVNQFWPNKIINSTTGDTAHADTASDHYSVDLFVTSSSEGDYFPPDVTIDTPADGAIVSGTVDITFTATDDNPIISESILINGVEKSITASYSWDTTQYSEGLHTIRCEATDNSSNTGFDEITVTVDNDGFVADPSSIVINEFLADPNTAYTEEWIELYNPLSEAVDISGCVLDDITGGGTSPYTIPAGTSIPANGFLVFYQGTTGIGLNNAGDTVNYLDTDGSTIIDSHSYTSSSDDVSIGRETDGSSTWTTFDSPTPGASNDGGSSGGSVADVVINEFLPDPYSLYTEEWIELYNPTSYDIALDGCVLDDITSGGGSPYTIPADTTINAGGFVLFYQNSFVFSLNNDGDTVNFIDTDGSTIIDSHSYTSSSDDVSIGRETDGSSTWTTFDSPTPGASNDGGSSSGSPSDVVLNEMLPDPYVAYSEEWIELYNPTGSLIDLSGCVLDDLIDGGTAPYTIPVGTTIEAYGYLVFYQGTTGIALNNAGDDCNLIDTDGTTIIDSYSYSSSSNDVSHGRETDGSSTWTTFTSPTPGSSNDTASSITVELAVISRD